MERILEMDSTYIDIMAPKNTYQAVQTEAVSKSKYNSKIIL